MNIEEARQLVENFKASMCSALPFRKREIDYFLTALFAGGHVLVEDYEGSGLEYWIRAVDVAIEGRDPDQCCRVLCHQDTDLNDILENLSNEDVILFSHLNRASLKFKTVITQAMKEKRILWEGKWIDLQPMFFGVATVNAHEGGTDMLPYEIADQFLFRLRLEPLAADREIEMLQMKMEQSRNVINVDQILEVRRIIEEQCPLDPGWDRPLVELANEINDSDKTMPNGRPSVSCLREYKEALRAYLFVTGKELAQGEDAFFALHEVALAHRFPRRPNIFLSGEKIVEECQKKLTLKKTGKLMEEKVEGGNVPVQETRQLSEKEMEEETAEKIKAAHRNATKKWSVFLEENGKPDGDIEDAWRVYISLRKHLEKKVFGRGDRQEDGEKGMGTLNLILAAFFAQGHILFEDYPGTGKSFMVECLAEMIKDDETDNIEAYRRIQCVPDLMPSDLTGYEALEGTRTTFKKGPLFAYMVLMDEINRTTPKVQAAMLEAMAEKRITVGERTYKLGDVFFVMATQNPLDKVGTFPLPAAQLDRFIFKRRLKPIKRNFVGLIINPEDVSPDEPIGIKRIKKAIKTIQSCVHPNPVSMTKVLTDLAERFDGYTKASAVDDPSRNLLEGSKPSPRSLQKLAKVLKTMAFIKSNGEPKNMVVTPSLIPLIACDYFRHRIYWRSDEKTVDLSRRDAMIRETVAEVVTEFRTGEVDMAAAEKGMEYWSDLHLKDVGTAFEAKP